MLIATKKGDERFTAVEKILLFLLVFEFFFDDFTRRFFLPALI
jgi:hypothetical protein